MFAFPLNPMRDQEILTGLGTITVWIKTWAVPLAAIGTVSMALLQTAKNLFPLRSGFQRRRFRKWLETASATPPGWTTHEDLKSLKFDSKTAETDLIALASAGDSESFYELPIEQMCTQIRGVSTVVLDYPAEHAALLHCLVSQANSADIEHVLVPPTVEVLSKRPDQQSDHEKKKVREYAAAKTRLAAQTRCTIDAIQTSIGSRWKRSLQLASFFLSAILGWVSLLLGVNKPETIPSFPSVLLIGLLSGFLAPVARDLVAAVESWRSN
jgi:hypothetical protein